METVETLRDCGDIMRLLETWHGVQSGSRRKAEFEWVGMVGVGLGRRTAIRSLKPPVSVEGGDLSPLLRL